VGGILSAARDQGKPATVLCGEAEVRPEDVPTASLIERFGRERAFGQARLALIELAEEIAGRAGALPSRP